ncbi:MAG TPA: hypothetical protein VIF09_26800 [Polyangiaceae bacterium]
MRLLGLIVAATFAAALWAALGCGPGGAGPGVPSASGIDDACLAALFLPGGSACVDCMRSDCSAQFAAFETECSGAIDCVCPAGTYAPSAARSPACRALATQASCTSASAGLEPTACSACTAACGGAPSTGSSGSSGGSGSGTTSGGGSSSGDTSGSGSDSGSTSSSGSGSSSGSSCEDVTLCTTQCTQSTCSNGSAIQYCMSSVCLCWDTCYFLVGGQRFACASCSDADVASCRTSAFSSCQ